jgi:hypothetical protein
LVLPAEALQILRIEEPNAGDSDSHTEDGVEIMMDLLEQ